MTDFENKIKEEFRKLGVTATREQLVAAAARVAVEEIKEAMEEACELVDHHPWMYPDKVDHYLKSRGIIES